MEDSECCNSVSAQCCHEVQAIMQSIPNFHPGMQNVVLAREEWVEQSGGLEIRFDPHIKSIDQTCIGAKLACKFERGFQIAELRTTNREDLFILLWNAYFPNSLSTCFRNRDATIGFEGAWRGDRVQFAESCEGITEPTAAWKKIGNRLAESSFRADRVLRIICICDHPGRWQMFILGGTLQREEASHVVFRCCMSRWNMQPTRQHAPDLTLVTGEALDGLKLCYKPDASNAAPQISRRMIWHALCWRAKLL